MTHQDISVKEMLDSFDGKIMLVPQEMEVVREALYQMYEIGYQKAKTEENETDS
jgi:hypothetical protein